MVCDDLLRIHSGDIVSKLLDKKNFSIYVTVSQSRGSLFIYLLLLLLLGPIIIIIIIIIN